jgi:predicted amidohydrolase YtcJ
MPLHADLIVHNASLLTMNELRPLARAMAVRRGIIEAVGEDAEVLALAGPDSVVHDLHGRTVVPGFHDCHLHLLWFGKMLTGQADLVGCSSVDEVISRMRSFAAGTNGWISGFGFDQDKLEEKRFPTRADLDRISAARPIIVTRVCAHAAVANTAAIGLLSDSERARGDEPTGLYTENAIRAFYDKIPDPDDEALERALLAACKVALRTGITSVQTMLDSADQLKVFTRLKNRLGRLPIRVVAMPPESAADALFEHGIVTGFGDDWLRIGGAKFFSDGSLGARTALLASRYADDPSAIGERIYPDRKLHERIREVAKMGFQIVVHAIGDQAVRETIDAIEGALDGADNRVARHRIEHASVCPPDQLQRLANLHIVTTLQPQFVTSDIWTGERLGRERAPWAYPFASMLRAGVPVGLSSDCPVEKLDAFACLAAAVGRHAWSPDETLTPIEAIRAYTLGSAFCAHRETRVGSLEPGKHADFVVLSANPLQTSPEALYKLRAERVFVAGQEAAI